jgi:hypothetical protein
MVTVTHESMSYNRRRWFREDGMVKYFIKNND